MNDTPRFQAPRRRRLYLMRHGSVDYFTDDGRPLPPHTVPLNDKGRAQADAAGALFAAAGVRFDRVVVSGLARTVETASRVLVAAGQSLPAVVAEDLQEIRPGRLEDIPRDELVSAFTAAFGGAGDVESHRFLGGETVGQLMDRCLPAFAAQLADPSWTCALWVLHGGVNRALLGRAIAGARFFAARLEQSPACINVLDVAMPGTGTPAPAGAAPAADTDLDVVVRAVNLAPTQWLHERERFTTMEKLLAQYLRQG